MRGITKFFLFFLLPLIILIGCLPMIASTPWASKKILTWAGEKKKLELSASKLSVSWLGPQIVRGLVIEDRSNGVQFQADEVKCSSSLFRLLFSSHPYADVQIDHAALALQMPKMQPVHFENIHLEVNWPSELMVSGDTANGKFNIEFEKLSTGIQLQAHLTHFPLYAMDRLLSLYIPHTEDLLLTLIGPTLELDLSLKTEGVGQLLKLHALGDHFSADLNTQWVSNTLVLEKPAQIQFQLTNPLLKLLGIPFALSAPAPATIEITEIKGSLESVAGSLSIQPLLLENRDIASFLGNHLLLDFSYTAPFLQLGLTTPTLQLPDLNFKMGKEWTLQKPAQLQILPLHIALLSLPSPTTVIIETLSAPPFSLKGKMEIVDLNINHFSLHNALVSFDLQKGKELDIDINSQTLVTSIQAKLGETLILKGSSPSMHLESLGDLSNLSFNIQYSPSIGSLEAKLSAHSMAQNTSGELHFAIEKDEHRLDCKLDLEKFPSSFLDILGRGAPLLGPLVTAHGQMTLTDFSGPLSLHLFSSTTRVSVEGELREGLLYLKEPLHAQLLLTPELTPLILQEVNPLSVPSLSSQSPLTLEIASEKTTIPLFPMDFSKLNISSARLELGQITCANVGNISYALSLLKQPANNELHLWFAPTDFSAVNGIVDVERTEILINQSLDMCTWGKIDLPRDSVDMVIGLTAQVLKKAFGIKDLPSNYVLQLPMHGPLSNVKIDSGKATRKIALLLLWQKGAATGAIAGGIPGAIAGEIFGKIATLPDRNSKAPPAKHPFPWEQEKVKSEKTRHKGIKFKKEGNAVHSLLKFLK